METAGYFRILRRHLLLVVVTALVGIAVAVGISQTITPTYRAQATLFLKVQAASTSLYERSQFALQRVQSYPQLLESPSLLQDVIARLSLHTTPQQLAKRVSATNPPSTVLVNVTADAPTPREAAAIANAASDELSKNVNALEDSETASKNAISLSPQIEAQPPQSPSSPNVPVLLGLGALVGLVLGFLLALLLELLRPTMRNADDVRRVLGLPLVAQLPSWRVRPRAKLEASAAGEAAALHLRALGGGTVPPVLLLAPVGRRAAAPLVRYLLALGLADTGRRVAVIETDVVGGLPKGVDIPARSRGLSEALDRRVNAGTVVVPRAAADRVDVLPAGDIAVAPSAFQIESEIGAVVGTVAAAHDTTLVQASETGRPVNLASIASATPAALLVVSNRATTERAARRMAKKLHVLGVTPVGVVMVGAPLVHAADLMETWQESDFITVTTTGGTRAVRSALVGAGRSDDGSAREAG